MSRANGEYILRIGETADIKRSFFGTSSSVIYAGMPGESVYSLAVTSKYGYQAMAYNLYLPVDEKKIRLPKGSLVVTYVSAGELHFTVEA